MGVANTGLADARRRQRLFDRVESLGAEPPALGLGSQPAFGHVGAVHVPGGAQQTRAFLDAEPLEQRAVRNDRFEQLDSCGEPLIDLVERVAVVGVVHSVSGTRHG